MELLHSKKVVSFKDHGLEINISPMAYMEVAPVQKTPDDIDELLYYSGSKPRKV